VARRAQVRESRLPEGWWLGFALLGLALLAVVAAVVTAILVW
jgi:hypothetical protein